MWIKAELMAENNSHVDPIHDSRDWRRSLPPNDDQKAQVEVRVTDSLV